MTTPERVAELLREDEDLTDEQRDALLAELFRTAYDTLTAPEFDNESDPALS